MQLSINVIFNQKLDLNKTTQLVAMIKGTSFMGSIFKSQDNRQLDHLDRLSGAITLLQDNAWHIPKEV